MDEELIAKILFDDLKTKEEREIEAKQVRLQEEVFNTGDVDKPQQETEELEELGVSEEALSDDAEAREEQIRLLRQMRD